MDKRQQFVDLQQKLRRLEQAETQGHGLHAYRHATLPDTLTPANDVGGGASSLSLPPFVTQRRDPLLHWWRQAYSSDILTRPAVHEIYPQIYGDLASLSFMLLSLKMLLRDQREKAPILWCVPQYEVREMGHLYGAGLTTFDLDPGQFIFVTPKSAQDTLWTLEEAANSKSFAAIVGHVEDPSFTQTRRLSLACQKGLTPLFLHRPHDCQGTSAAFSRWRIESQPSARNPLDQRAPGTRKIKAHLVRARTGQTGSWSLEYETTAYPLYMVSQPANRTFADRVAARSRASLTGERAGGE
ncbi:ImuA family protein [Maritalea mediterranea]|uniref:Protein ImuA n=1 Tax=Maritalea mediterranea TaxID=2909667 RepID=A0ABS9E4G6_9HYPH|nr:hypothetical protein [Maritalea mediterranea]MCF4097149.1 hypothetical protein [Maritalea mediterranea]